MIHVLHVLSGFDHRSGGPLAALGGLARAQAAVGMRVTVAVAYYPSDHQPQETAREWAASGVTMRLIGPATGPFHTAPTMAAELREVVGRSDVVHIHALWDEINHRAAVEARRARKPYVIRPCGQLDPTCLAQSGLKKQLYLAWRMRRNLNGAAALHFTSAGEAELTRPLRLAPPALVESNGVDLAEFETLPARGSFRARYPQIGERPLVLMLGRIHRIKGLDLLLPAFARMGVEEAVLALAGPDDEGYQATLEAQARELSIEHRVIFTGMLRGAERVEALADADLFALPSYHENFGIAVVEALAAGTPVVVSDQVQIHHEITQAGVGGVTPTQVAPLAAELHRWLSDGELRHRAAKGSPPFVWSRYNWKDIARRWVGHYNTLIPPAVPS